ncbi:MAG: DUF3313 family protein [Woeseiaceae bacterium]|nr:DUF3313 family protein [Woeseiaceae bacterium]
MKTKNILVTLAAAAMLATGPVLAKSPTIDTSDPGLMTVDGLYPVKHSRLDDAFAKPDFNLSQYAKVRIMQPGIAYRRNSYELSEKQAEKMVRYFNEALVAQLEKKGYELVDSVGPDVLLVDANIIDMKINRPTERTTGRTTIFTASSGEMTLIGELRDSRSGELLARFADRQQPRSYWAESTSVREWSDARRAFNFWAKILADRLDSFHEEDE